MGAFFLSFFAEKDGYSGASRSAVSMKNAPNSATCVDAKCFRSYTDYIFIETETRYSIVDITDKVVQKVLESKIIDGMVLVSTMHITSSIFVNDHEPGLWHDIMSWLEELAPAKTGYHHHQTGEDNADAHLKRAVLGHQVILPITRGALDLGPWERVHYGEFDGMRSKRIIVKVQGVIREE